MILYNIIIPVDFQSTKKSNEYYTNIVHNVT